MKLALIRRKFTATGGAELYLQRLMRSLVDAGHEVHLFTESWSEAPESIEIHGVPVSGGRTRGPVAFANGVCQQLTQLQFDCVFSLERTPFQDVYRAGDGVHRVWLERRKQFAPWWKKPWVGRGAFHRNMLQLETVAFDSDLTNLLIVNSEMVRNEIIRCFNFPAERIHLVRNGIEVNRFQGLDRAVARERYGLAADELVLLFVGSGWERKGLKMLTNEILPRWCKKSQRPTKLLVVGKGSTRGLNSANVIFAGPDREVQWAYAAADIFVFLPIYEPSANVCFEALAAGLPVITTEQNGASEVLKENVNGTVLADPQDVEGALAAIEFWSRNRDKVQVDYDLSLERNVRETIQVLELAARARREPSR